MVAWRNSTLTSKISVNSATRCAPPFNHEIPRKTCGTPQCPAGDGTRGELVQFWPAALRYARFGCVDGDGILHSAGREPPRPRASALCLRPRGLLDQHQGD